MEIINDVVNYSKYYSGKDVPPVFYHERFDLKGKLFVPVDDFKLGQKLSDNMQEEVILHYFEYDSKQNRLLANNLADKDMHAKVYAVTSPDFSVDSTKCWQCLNDGNILKSRICAYRWQSECGLPVILTLIWGEDKSTYKLAFGNVEKESVVAVSSQGVEDQQTFENGIRVAIDTIQPEYICWYGKVFDFMKNYYDKSRIIKMQPRRQLMKMIKEKNSQEALLFDICQKKGNAVGAAFLCGD